MGWVSGKAPSYQAIAYSAFKYSQVPLKAAQDAFEGLALELVKVFEVFAQVGLEDARFPGILRDLLLHCLTLGRLQVD